MTESGLEESEGIPPAIEEEPTEVSDEPEGSARNESRVNARSGLFGVIYQGFLSIFDRAA